MKKVSISNIDALLPQSQCQQCDYPSCYDYAKAIIEQHEAINKCAYGGEQIMLKLAGQLNIAAQYPVNEIIANRIAFIDERNCIGCMKCIHACPTEAIIGTRRQLHTVIGDYCTGCNLCVPPCPTECITLIAIPALAITPAKAKERFNAKKSRQVRKPPSMLAAIDPRKRAVAEAIARAKAKKAQQSEFKIDLTLYKK